MQDSRFWDWEETLVNGGRNGGGLRRLVMVKVPRLWDVKLETQRREQEKLQKTAETDRDGDVKWQDLMVCLVSILNARSKLMVCY